MALGYNAYRETGVSSWAYRNTVVMICMRNTEGHKGSRECRYTKYSWSTIGTVWGNGSLPAPTIKVKALKKKESQSLQNCFFFSRAPEGGSCAADDCQVTILWFIWAGIYWELSTDMSVSESLAVLKHKEYILNWQVCMETHRQWEWVVANGHRTTRNE